MPITYWFLANATMLWLQVGHIAQLIGDSQKFFLMNGRLNLACHLKNLRSPAVPWKHQPVQQFVWLFTFAAYLLTLFRIKAIARAHVLV